MEWMAIIGDSIQYIEEHITEDVTADEVAKSVGVSPFYFRRDLPCSVDSAWLNISATEGWHWLEMIFC